MDIDEFNYFDVYVIFTRTWHFLGVFETEKIDSFYGGNNQWMSGLRKNEAGLWETSPKRLPGGAIVQFVESDREGFMRYRDFVRYRKDMGLDF